MPGSINPLLSTINRDTFNQYNPKESFSDPTSPLVAPEWWIGRTLARALSTSNTHIHRCTCIGGGVRDMALNGHFPSLRLPWQENILHGHAWHFQNIHGKSMDLCGNPCQMPISMEKGYSAMANGDSFAMEKEICPWKVRIPPWKEELCHFAV